jgi:uncharacterized caspase-like protein
VTYAARRNKLPKTEDDMRPWIALFATILCSPAYGGVTVKTEKLPDAAYLEALTAQALGIGDNLTFGPVPEVVACGAGTPATRGLLVGANRWSGNRSMDLAGAENDTDLMLKGLVARGAQRENLVRLIGDTATRAGYEAAANALLAATNCGDSVLLHLSGWAFGADWFEPAVDPIEPLGPFSHGEDGASLKDRGGFGLGVQPANALIAKGPWYLLSQSQPGRADLLSTAALSDFVTRLRNRGADVTVIVDTSSAEDMRIEDRQAQVDPAGLWRNRLNPEGVPIVPPQLLSFNAGGLTVLYGTASGELTVEMLLPKGAPDRAYYGAFSFTVVQALLNLERTTPAALTRRLETEDLGYDYERRWTYLVSTTAPDQDIIVEGRPPVVPGGGAIRILDPAPTRAATPLNEPVLTLRGVVEASADTMVVTVNGRTALSTPDGAFSAEITLEAGVNRIDILAMTRDNQPITHSFELFFEGDMQALLGTGARYAVLIANQDYAPGSGFAPLATPIGDAEALAAILTTRYGFQTEAMTQEGQTIPLFLRNATRLDIETLLYQVGRIAGAKDTVLIFYAGHGIYEQVTQGAFWLPVDAKAGLPFSYLPAAAITDAVLRINAGNVLVISDSCYSGALLRGEESAEAVTGDRLRALQRLADKRSRIVITSGGNEPVLDGGGGGHSVFARSLLTGLAAMEEEAFTARELFDRFLLPMVVGQSAQEPQYRPIERSGHEGGDVVLAKVGG